MLRVSNFVLRNSKKFNNLKVERRCITTATNLQSKQPDPAAEKDKRSNLSFMANMFLGRIETTEAFPYPNAINDEQKETISMLIDPVNRFFTEVNDPVRNDDNAKLDDATADGLWELGAFSLQVPQEYGGAQLTNTQYSRMGEIVGGADLGVGIVVGAHQSIGFKGILLVGTPEQKAKYLPMVSTGKHYAAFCLTEPSSGSDAGSIRSRAVKSECGKYYILNGSKIWISNGGIAEIMTVFAQTEIIDPKTGAKRDKVTAFIVERSFGGVKSGPPEKKMGIKCSNTAEIVYEDCRIPIENVLGGEGNGFKVAMNILNNGRFGMAGTLSGTMKACIAKATDFATTRTQFGKKINSFQGVQEKLARMTMYHYAAQSMAYMIAGNMDLGSQDYHLEAAISKVFASEAAWYVCDEAIQIMGGMGFMKDTGLERIMRDLRIFRIFEGTNDILRLFVALTGIQYAGSHLKELQRAFKNPTANLGLIFQESTKRAMRSFGIGGLSMNDVVDPSLQESAKLTAECIELFGSVVESLLIKYNKTIVDQQFLLNRLADAAIDTYAMVVVLSRATRSIKENKPTAEFEKLMAMNWCIEGSTRAKASLAKINNSQYTKYFSNVETLAKEISAENGIFYKSPIGV